MKKLAFCWFCFSFSIAAMGPGNLSETVQQKSIVVDARFPAQFKRGHVNNAINIPYYVTRSELKKRMSGVESDQSVVVYCAGPKCPFATVVARMLRAQGRKSVYVYEGEDLELHRAVLQSIKADGVLP